MLLIVSIKIMILHTDRLLPTWRVFKLLPLTGGGEICHRKNYLGEATTLGCERNTFRRQRHHTAQNDVVGGGCLPEEGLEGWLQRAT
jgi:hypothetical protein